MITKPSELYFKDGIWGWDAANSTWVKLEVDASGYLKIAVSASVGLKSSDLNLDGAKDLQVDVKTSALPSGAATAAKQNQLEGWDGAAWHKLPMLWGFSDRLVEVVSGTASGAGDATATITAVPAGYVYVVQAIMAYHIAGSNKVLHVTLRSTSDGPHLLYEAAAVSGSAYMWAGEICLEEDDVIKAVAKAPGDTKPVYLRVWGYKMKVAE